MTVATEGKEDLVFRDELGGRPTTAFRVLVPVANPLTCGAMIQLAAALASQRSGEVIALHIVSTLNHGIDDESKRSAESRRSIMEEAVNYGRGLPSPVHTVTRVAGSIAQGILDTAREENASLIVMGWQGRVRSISLGTSLGEVLDPVIKEAPCDLAVVKSHGLTSIQRILVPTAGGPNAVLALNVAMALSKVYHSEITLLHVAKGADQGQGRRMIARTMAGVRGKKSIRQEVIIAGNVVKGILKEVKDYDLVILGATRQGVFRQILFGSVPEGVAKRCPKTVIMVKGYEGPLVSGLRRVWTTFLGARSLIVALR
ncbi:MAG: universal stress protein [Chloroflexi bacterium]|nr:universal stress protein [Chloroflexota bacterium]